MLSRHIHNAHLKVESEIDQLERQISERGVKTILQSLKLLAECLETLEDAEFEKSKAAVHDPAFLGHIKDAIQAADGRLKDYTDKIHQAPEDAEKADPMQ